MSRYNNQQGIALIQVLLISATLSVLALYLTQTAKSQVQQAQWGDDRSQAQVAVHSAEALLLFELLTKKKTPTISASGNDDVTITKLWNFSALPFKINNNVMVKIQDQSGLIQLHYPNRTRLKKLIATTGLSQNQVEVVIDNLLDWQDIDNIQRQNGAEAIEYGGAEFIRNGAVPSIHDVIHVKSISLAIQQLLLRNATIYKSGAFSPINAPAELLYSLTNKSAVEQVIALRRLNRLTSKQFSEITGIVEDDSVYFYTSNYLMIDLTSSIGEAKANKQIFIHLQPYAEGVSKPFNIFISRG